MKKSVMFGIAVLVSAAIQAYATPITYDITFSGGGSAANGQITVDNGLATGGFLDVTAGAAQGVYDLYTWSGGGISSVRVSGGTDLIVDNVVMFGSNPWLDIYGLAFVNGDLSEGLDLSLAFGTTYNLGGYGVVGYGQPNADGVATIALVPDGGGTAILLGASLGTLALISRNRKSNLITV